MLFEFKDTLAMYTRYTVTCCCAHVCDQILQYMCTEQTLSARRNQAHPPHQATTCNCGRPRSTSVVTEYWHSMPNVFCLTWEMVLESTLDVLPRVVVSGATTDDNTKKRVMAVKQMLRDVHNIGLNDGWKLLLEHWHFCENLDTFMCDVHFL